MEKIKNKPYSQEGVRREPHGRTESGVPREMPRSPQSGGGPSHGADGHFLGMLTIKTSKKVYIVPEGKPCIVRWGGKNKTRPGVSTAVGWIKRGERPRTFELVQSCFETWDEVEREYPVSWQIFESRVLSIVVLKAAEGRK